MNSDDIKKEENIQGVEIIQKPKKNLRKMLVIMAIAGIVFFIGVKIIGNIKNTLFGKKQEETSEVEVIGEGSPVKVYKVKRIDFKDTLPVLGIMKGYKEISLKFQTSGLLESFNFEEGERVQEGDIIANLEQKDGLLKLKYAELEMENAKKMLDIGAIINNAFEKTKLEYESAKSDLEKTNIYALSEGVLGLQEVDVGSYVTPNDKIGVFVDITKVFGEFNIIEKDIPKIKLGEKSEIFIDALPKETFTGTVDTISPLISGRTRAQKIKVELKNKDGQIKPGMFARGLITTYEKNNALIIPASSLKKQEEGYVVYIVHRDEMPEEIAEDAEEVETVEEGEEDKEEETEIIVEDEPRDMGTVEVRPIKVGYMTQDKIEVEEGIEEGDVVVMEIYQDLADKDRVEIVEEQEILY
ncbi:MAG: efflux RND transporter periplasmic adaptor subunit [Candidatus Omnitrophica bacterium]|nr:efflux RND transporter periplasmic adaptor subunit [Candidatus Omnitrophota bacterium]